ncbi:hypothetical protein B0T20DRAFT_474141 [Sordaria brevicollis]|uniref:Uncharacterized protein n=1 Tax=Sordaria brevicollis TaxID=83679 RepID=A0AAE0NRA5_SORBR|nr:hypothetical protein B0T20DRAFT_474141 [Sordaria brevicollis]
MASSSSTPQGPPRQEEHNWDVSDSANLGITSYVPVQKSTPTNPRPYHRSPSPRQLSLTYLILARQKSLNLDLVTTPPTRSTTTAPRASSSSSTFHHRRLVTTGSTNNPTNNPASTTTTTTTIVGTQEDKKPFPPTTQTTLSQAILTTHHHLLSLQSQRRESAHLASLWQESVLQSQQTIQAIYRRTGFSHSLGPLLPFSQHYNPGGALEEAVNRAMEIEAVASFDRFVQDENGGGYFIDLMGETTLVLDDNEMERARQAVLAVVHAAVGVNGIPPEGGINVEQVAGGFAILARLVREYYILMEFEMTRDGFVEKAAELRNEARRVRRGELKEKRRELGREIRREGRWLRWDYVSWWVEGEDVYGLVRKKPQEEEGEEWEGVEVELAESGWLFEKDVLDGEA